LSFLHIERERDEEESCDEILLARATQERMRMKIWNGNLLCGMLVEQGDERGEGGNKYSSSHVIQNNILCGRQVGFKQTCISDTASHQLNFMTKTVKQPARQKKTKTSTLHTTTKIHECNEVHALRSKQYVVVRNVVGEIMR
jgi:hypothetical protein